MSGNRVEKKQARRESTELKLNLVGEVTVEELFFLRLGRLSFRQSWLDREVSPSLTVVVMLGIGMVGLLAGLGLRSLMERVALESGI